MYWPDWRAETNIKHDDDEPNAEGRLRLDALGLVNAAVVKPFPAMSVFGRLHQQSPMINLIAHAAHAQILDGFAITKLAGDS
ncbi:hypothetical protein E4U32_004162 [Claviceps aff. humidiphila group G2b]|nr:hypothetical protein E4U32_004162 [Claviceps aff. humidiphila group G2b]